MLITQVFSNSRKTFQSMTRSRTQHLSWINVPFAFHRVGSALYLGIRRIHEKYVYKRFASLSMLIIQGISGKYREIPFDSWQHSFAEPLEARVTKHERFLAFSIIFSDDSLLINSKTTILTKRSDDTLITATRYTATFIQTLSNI